MIIYLIDLAAKCHIDLPAAIHDKLQKNAQKYPTPGMNSNVMKYSLYEERNLVGSAVPPDRAREEGDGSE